MTFLSQITPILAVLFADVELVANPVEITPLEQFLVQFGAFVLSGMASFAYLARGSGSFKGVADFMHVKRVNLVATLAIYFVIAFLGVTQNVDIASTLPTVWGLPMIGGTLLAGAGIAYKVIQ